MPDASLDADERELLLLIGARACAPPARALALAASATVLLLRHDARDLDDAVAGRRLEDALALAGAALLGQLVRRDACAGAARGEDHELVAGEQLLDRDERARALVDGERCGADPAAALDRVLGDARALGVAVLRDGAEAGLAAHDHHADGAVALAQVDAAHTLRGPADRGDLRFGEADRAALPRDQHDVVRAVRELDVEQAV